MEDVLTTEGLSIGFKTKEKEHIVFDNLNLNIRRGELLCLLGPNGVGKSTLIRTFMGIQPALSGEVSIDNQPMESYSSSELSLKIGAMITEKIDVDFLNVYDLVCIGRYPHTHWLRGMKSEDHEQVGIALKAMEVEQFSQKSLNHLSDGERQRVLIARALAQDTELLLLDEPTSFLDLPHKVETLRLLRNWAYEKQKAILLSTHDFELAMNIADRIWLMGKDKKMHDGSPEDLFLNGSFANCFNSEHVSIDSSTGHFEIKKNLSQSVQVSTSDTNLRFWAGKALRRAGFLDSDEDSHTKLVIGSTEKWEVHMDNQSFSFDNLYSCIQKLKSKLI